MTLKNYLDYARKRMKETDLFKKVFDKLSNKKSFLLLKYAN